MKGYFRRSIALYLILLCGLACENRPVRDDDTRMAEELKKRSGSDPSGNLIRVYPFNSGIFTFFLRGTGAVPDRQLIIHIDEYGHFESQQSVTGDPDRPVILNWIITRGLDLWHLDPETETAVLAVMDVRYASGIDWNALIDQHGSPDAAEKHLEQNRITILPDETIAGYPCQVIRRDLGPYSLMRWVYQGLDVQMAVVMPPDHTITLTRELVSAAFDVPVPGHLFEIPEHYTVESTVLQ